MMPTEKSGTRPLPVVVLISGRGSNLKAIIDARDQEALPVDLRAVISDRADAAGLRHARAAGIETRTLNPADFRDRGRFDQALLQTIESFAPGLVVLAGFMRLLSPDFVHHYAGRLLNIHPSLLPAFKGLNTHRRALEAGVHEHGASVHWVTEELDGGPVVLQASLPVIPDDTPATLAARVLKQEHRIYPAAIRWIAEDRLAWNKGHILFDGRPLEAAIQWHEIEH